MADQPVQRLERLPTAPGHGADAALSVRLPSDVSLVDTVVELFAGECFAPRAPSRQTVFRLRVTLAEALANAILCGNGGDRDKVVEVRADLFPDRIRLTVVDQGSGFDPDGVPDPLHPERLDNPRGRGLFIIRHLADEVAFNEKGNAIWMTLPRW